VTSLHVPPRCLILACGNTLRGDDGVGPWLAAWAEDRFCRQLEVQVISRQQWTPELAEDIARVRAVLFLDCSLLSPAGAVTVAAVDSATPGGAARTHHQGAPELLALAQELFGAGPQTALMLTVGAGSTSLGEVFSEPVMAALPEACRQLEALVLQCTAADTPGQ